MPEDGQPVHLLPTVAMVLYIKCRLQLDTVEGVLMYPPWLFLTVSNRTLMDTMMQDPHFVKQLIVCRT